MSCLQKLKTFFSKLWKDDETKLIEEEGICFDHNGELVEINEVKVEMVEKKSLPRILIPFLPDSIEDWIQHHRSTPLVIFDRVSMVAYQVEFNELVRLGDVEKLTPDEHFLTATLLTLNFGYLDEEKTGLFTFITRDNDRSIPYILEKMESFKPIPTKDWWEYWKLTKLSVRHVRLSSYEAYGRIYDLPLSQWFKTKERPEYPVEEKEPPRSLFESIFDLAKETPLYRIEVIENSINIFVKHVKLSRKKSDQANKEVAKVIKDIRERFPKDKVTVFDEKTGESYRILTKR